MDFQGESPLFFGVSHFVCPGFSFRKKGGSILFHVTVCEFQKNINRGKRACAEDISFQRIQALDSVGNNIKWNICFT